MFRRRTAMLLSSLYLWSGPAWASPGSLPALAEEEGLASVAEAVRAMEAESKSAKKLDKALADADFAGLSMPVGFAFGAELVLSEPTDLRDCSWSGGATCGFEAMAPETASAADFSVACRTRYGIAMELEATSVDVGAGRLGWKVAGVDRCWDVGGVGIAVRPRSVGDLEGVGTGDDYHPPELVQLSQDEVEEIIGRHDNSFRYCFRKHAAPGSSGKLIIRYEIAPDGSVASTKFESNTLQDPAVEACVLERFGRIDFPKPMGGYEGGTWPLTFLKPE